MKIEATRALASATEPVDAAKHAKVAAAAREFESILVKQLLASAHVLGKSKGGYADMALDALAGGITAGGGLGLARAIEDSVQAAEISPKASLTKR